MCRALLYLGEPVLLDDLLFQPDSSLVKQSYMPRMLQMLNLAGFGMMVWDHGSHNAELPFRYGSTTIPVFDRNLKSLSRKNARPGKKARTSNGVDAAARPGAGEARPGGGRTMPSAMRCLKWAMILSCTSPSRSTRLPITRPRIL